MEIIEAKNIVAKEAGYDDWDTLYNWVARKGQKPEVVAQLIESYTSTAYSFTIQNFEDGIKQLEKAILNHKETLPSITYLENSKGVNEGYVNIFIVKEVIKKLTR